MTQPDPYAALAASLKDCRLTLARAVCDNAHMLDLLTPSAELFTHMAQAFDHIVSAQATLNALRSADR